ncbi:hypothetical protein ACG7TL_004931 [Trametes sanguinea]
MRFQTIIGSLLYIMLGTQPDIAFAVTVSIHGASLHLVSPIPSSTPKILSVLHTSTPNSVQSKIEDNVREDPHEDRPSLFICAFIASPAD